MPATKRQIVGLSLSPETAQEFKTEAVRQGVSLKKLFEKMWQQYKQKPASKKT